MLRDVNLNQILNISHVLNIITNARTFLVKAIISLSNTLSDELFKTMKMVFKNRFVKMDPLLKNYSIYVILKLKIILTSGLQMLYSVNSSLLLRPFTVNTL